MASTLCKYCTILSNPIFQSLGLLWALSACGTWLGMGVAEQWPGSLSQRHNKQANFSIELLPLLLLLLLLANKAPFALPFTAKYYVYVMCFLLHCNERTQQAAAAAVSVCVCVWKRMTEWCGVTFWQLRCKSFSWQATRRHTHTHRDEWEWSLWQRTLDTRVHLIVFVSDGSQWPSAVGNARVSRKWKQASNEDYEYCMAKAKGKDIKLVSKLYVRCDYQMSSILINSWQHTKRWL